MDYICNNFNFGKYNVVIRIAPGEYNENVKLYDYTTSGGRLDLIGENTGTDGLATVIRTSAGPCITCTMNSYGVTNIKFVKDYSVSVNNFTSAISVQKNAILSLDRFEMVLNFSSDMTSGKNFRPFSIMGSLIFSLLHTDSAGPSKITVNNYSQGMESLFRVDGGSIEMIGARTSYPNIICSGACATFMALTGRANFSRNLGYNPVLGFSGTMTGKRYSVAAGSSCNTGGMGAEYFPGDTAGTADATTYAYYK